MNSRRRDRRAGPDQAGAVTVLVVEDDTAYREVLRYNLEAAGYRVIVSADGGDALERAELENPDVIVLDWMLPGPSGLEVCRTLRSRRPTRRTPIIMVTAKSEETDRIMGLDTGADDYLVKSQSGVGELVARVRALLRRAGAPAPREAKVEVGGIAIDHLAVRVTREGQELLLKPTEFRLLAHLARQPGRVFTRGQLLAAVWGNNIHVEERTVDAHVARLRRALCKTGLSDPIRTVRSVGYALEEDRSST